MGRAIAEISSREAVEESRNEDRRNTISATPSPSMKPNEGTDRDTLRDMLEACTDRQ